MIETDRADAAKLTEDSQLLQTQLDHFWRSHVQVPSRYRYNLTIANEPKFVWFRNAKVGTRTILSTLRDSSVELVSEAAYGCYYLPQAYADHFKFAFVRNPWDRLVSGWLNKVVASNRWGLDEETHDRLRDFDHFVDHCQSFDLERCDAHFRLQSRLIDVNEVDFVGRMEHFADDLREVFKILQIPLTHVVQRNLSPGRRPYQQYYNEETRQKVADMYRKDIHLFGYRFEGD